MLRGAGSWGDHHCGGGPTFSVFTRVSRFVDWIHETKNKPDFVPGKNLQMAFVVSLKLGDVSNEDL